MAFGRPSDRADAQCHFSSHSRLVFNSLKPSPTGPDATRSAASGPPGAQWLPAASPLDLYSRKIVGWEVHDSDESEPAAHLVRRAALSEGITALQAVPVLHGDKAPRPRPGRCWRCCTGSVSNRRYSRPRLLERFECKHHCQRECHRKQQHTALQPAFFPSTSATLAASSSMLNGLGRKLVPKSRMPWGTTAVLVQPIVTIIGTMGRSLSKRSASSRPDISAPRCL